MEVYKPEDEVNVNCSFCNKQIPCPKDMLSYEKHVCDECFEKQPNKINIDDVEEGKIHIAIPNEKYYNVLAKFVADAAIDGIFLDIWKEMKEKDRDLSKKDFSKKMFIHGVFAGVHGLSEIMNKDIKTFSKELGLK